MEVVKSAVFWDMTPYCPAGRHLEERVRYGGGRGSVVVKALCYKPEGRGFET
jgi:hypothetical protein